MGYRVIGIPSVYKALGPLSAPFVFCLSLTLSAIAGDALWADDALLKEKLANEAPKEWARFKDMYSHMDGRGVQKISNAPATDGWRLSDKIYFRINGELITLEEERYDDNQVLLIEKARGANSKYSFSLERNKSGVPWVSSSVNVDKNPVGPVGTKVLAYKTPVLMMLSAPWSIGDVTLQDLIADENINLKAVDFTDFEEKKCVSVQFSYLPKKDVQKGAIDHSKPRFLQVLSGGRIVLDHVGAWSVRSVELQFIEGVNTEWRVEYGGQQSGLPVISRIKGILSNPRLGKPAHYEIEFKDLKFRDIQESEFTLSVYGLPEPFGVVWPKPTNWWLRILVGSVVMLSLGVLFAAVKRRKSQAQNPKIDAKEGGS